MTGPGGTGKTYITNYVKQGLEDKGLRVALVESPTRRLADLGYTNNQQSTWQTQIASGISRQIRQRELEGDLGVDFVLADRAMSCELGYTQFFVEQQLSRGLDLFSTLEERDNFSQLLASRDMLRSLWSEDTCYYWDYVVFKEIDMNFPPESDEHRTSDLEWHLESQKHIRDAFFLHWGDILPTDRDRASEELLRKCLEISQEKGLL